MVYYSYVEVVVRSIHMSLDEPDCQMCRMYGELVLYMLGKIIKLPFDDIKKILRIGA